MAYPSVCVVRSDARIRLLPDTAGLIREEALRIGSLWAGCACTAPGGISGWHHHGAWNTVVFVTSGSVNLEFGQDGKESVRAEPGDFLFIPAGIIHREINPASVEQRVVVVRQGEGPLTINVDGPDVSDGR